MLGYERCRFEVRRPDPLTPDCVHVTCGFGLVTATKHEPVGDTAAAHLNGDSSP
jgi:hypothetical protein